VLIWQGRGVVAFVVPFFATLGLQLIVYQTGGRALWEQHVSGFFAIACGISVAIVYWLARRWEDPGRVLIDKATGQEITLKRTDSLFFVSLRLWPWILAAGAAVSVLYGILNRTL